MHKNKKHEIRKEKDMNPILPIRLSQSGKSTYFTGNKFPKKIQSPKQDEQNNSENISSDYVKTYVLQNSEISFLNSLKKRTRVELLELKSVYIAKLDSKRLSADGKNTLLNRLKEISNLLEDRSNKSVSNVVINPFYMPMGLTYESSEIQGRGFTHKEINEQINYEHKLAPSKDCRELTCKEDVLASFFDIKRTLADKTDVELEAFLESAKKQEDDDIQDAKLGKKDIDSTWDSTLAIEAAKSEIRDRRDGISNTGITQQEALDIISENYLKDIQNVLEDDAIKSWD